MKSPAREIMSLFKDNNQSRQNGELRPFYVTWTGARLEARLCIIIHGETRNSYIDFYQGWMIQLVAPDRRAFVWLAHVVRWEAQSHCQLQVKVQGMSSN